MNGESIVSKASFFLSSQFVGVCEQVVVSVNIYQQHNFFTLKKRMNLPVTTLASFLLFGSLILSYCVYRLVRLISPRIKNATLDSSVLATTPKQGAVSDGASDAEDFIFGLSKAGFELGILLLITFVCENYPLFEHANKVHDLDLFLMVIFVAFLFAFLFSFHQGNNDQGILNRDQTEEWRGFMQMIFLLYHYFAMEEVYPLIRLFISCYVFLTGFGNTSFFYLKRDYSIVRLLSMLWRLCFSCFALAMVHNNPIILYYIVPLHTFYFLVAYFTMSLFERKVNYSKYGLKSKLLVLGSIIYFVWEFPQVFQVFFSFLSSQPHPGAPVGAYGTLYEWQFRSGLDHYSSFFGMVFACVFPYLEMRDHSVVGKSLSIKVFGSIFFVIVLFLWFYWLFPLPKLVYNSMHPYTFVFPMVAYLFLRNLTPYLRKVHLSMFAFAGKYTLETYLLQHHVWLTSNAKTVLVFLPGFPKSNFVVVSIFYFVLSMKLFDLTVGLKNLLIPVHDAAAALKNLAFLAGCVGLCFSLAQAIVVLGEPLSLLVLSILILTTFWIIAGFTFITLRDHNRILSRGLILLALLFCVFGFVCAWFPAFPERSLLNCDSNQGDWVKSFTNLCGNSPQSAFTYCSSKAWAWPISNQKLCGWKKYKDLKLFDRIYVISSNDPTIAMALARIDNPALQYSDKYPQQEYGKVSITNQKQFESLKIENPAKTLVLCQETHEVCENFQEGIAFSVQGDEHQVRTRNFVVNAYAVKVKASADDILSAGVYRDDIYDVIAQVAVNQGAFQLKQRTTISSPSSPPPGGLAHSPVYGLAFLALAFFSLFMNDGYIAVIATLSTILGHEKQLSWEKSVEKLHANIPGLNSTATATELSANRGSTPVPPAVIHRARDKDPEHLSDADDTSTLIDKQ